MNWSKIIDYLFPVALVTVAFAMGFIFGEFKRINEHSDAEARCYSTTRADAYVSRIGKDEYVCFMEDYNRKKITKSLIVMP